MQIFTWTTNPYDIKNEQIIQSLNKYTLIRKITSSVGFGLIQYIYYVVDNNNNDDREIYNLIDEINYIPFTITIENKQPLFPKQALSPFVKHLVQNVFKIKVDTIETTKYTNYISYRPYFTPENYLDDVSLSVPIYVHPDQINSLLMRCDPTSFIDMTYLNNNMLTWLALENLKPFSENFTYYEQEGVFGYKKIDTDFDISIDNNVPTLVEKYKTTNVKYYRVSELSLEDANIIDELASMYEFEILSKYPFNTPYIYYRLPHTNYYFDLSDAISEIKRENIPILYFTGDWSLSVVPIKYFRALMKYASLRAYTQLVDINPNLAKSIIYVDVLADLTIVAPLSNNQEAETFSELLYQYSLLARFWTYFGVDNDYDGMLTRWKIQIAYKNLTPLTIKIDDEFILVIDTPENTENFRLPPVSENDKIYLREELVKYYSKCDVGIGSTSANDLVNLSLEELFELVIVTRKNNKPYCYSRNNLILYSSNLNPYEEKISYNVLYPEFGFYGYFGIPLVGGLLKPINELPLIKAESGNINIDTEGDYQIVTIDNIFFFEIKTSKISTLKNLLNRLYSQGKFLTPWGGSYMLFKNKLSISGLIGNKFLTNASDNDEKAKEALNYLNSL
jgi:hypothetical protein